ncbi:MAG: hypothetical protein LUE93_04735, partial [Bacteroides sp.]|nr:hypothetical protein [Bacteroides sp.]
MAKKSYSLLDLTDKVDRSKEFKIEPLSFNFQKGIFKYNDLGTYYEELYAGDNAGRSYGSHITNTGYQLEANEYNYLEGTIFDNCIVASGYSSYFNGRGGAALKDNKELPYLQAADGSKVNLSGYVLVFRDGIQTLNKDFRITDDTEDMTSTGTICWNNSSANRIITNQCSSYVRTMEKDKEVYSLNFGIPATAYGDHDALLENNRNAALYSRYWKAYIRDILDKNCKILTCYVFLEPSDINNNILRKFIYIDNTLWVISEINSFNPLSPA